MYEDLKPCPFCGSEARLFVLEDKGVSVKCTNPMCGMGTESTNDWNPLKGLTPWREGKTAVALVVERWNRRVE